MTPVFNKSVTNVTTTHWRVEIENIGEGLHGDYDASNPKDIPLLRFRILGRAMRSHSFVELDHNSFCTRLDWRVVENDAVMRARVLLHILERIEERSIDYSLKPITEALSWMDVSVFVKEFDANRVYVVGGREIAPASVLMNKTTNAVRSAHKIPPPHQVKVLVVIRGGMVAQVQATSGEVAVEVLDWDNVREGDTFHDLTNADAIHDLCTKWWPHIVW